MATIKSYTDLEQSKKLAEILPVESADMFFADGERPAVWNNKDVELDEDDIPCWSLAALFEEIPSTIVNKDDDDVALRIVKEDLQYYLYYDNLTKRYFEVWTNIYDNLIDACYEMILRLHEQNLL